jgi:hypothetical protein
MKKILFILAFTFCGIANAQENTTPQKLFLNTNILDYKLGFQFDGFCLGLDPTYVYSNKMRFYGYFDISALDGKIGLNDIADNDANLKRYRKFGLGVAYALFQTSGYIKLKYIRKTYIIKDYIVSEYSMENMPVSKELRIRGGLENSRFVAVADAYNGQANLWGGETVALRDGTSLVWYESITNWYLTSLYGGFSYDMVMNTEFEDQFFSKYYSIYFDVLYPAIVSVKDVHLNGATYDMKDSFKRNKMGWRIGVQSAGDFYIKWEMGKSPGIKRGAFFNTSIGYTFKFL